MSTTTLTADKIRQLNELVNVKKLSDLTDAPNIFDGADSSLLQTTYIPSTTYIANAKRYVNYKVKLEQLTKYLEHIGLNQIDDIERSINEILSHLVGTSSGQYIGLTYDETNNTYNIKQEYSQINSYGTWHEDYSYYTYNTLTPGIITSSVLDEYITYTMGRILGVPSTETALSEAIDSVVEFVDWFKDYGKNEDGLRALIDKIESKDAEIISSYMAGDTAINTRIDNLDADATAVEKQYITGFKQENGLIKNVTRKQITTSEISGLDTALANAQMSPGRFMKKETINDKTYLSTYIDINPTAYFDSNGVRYSLTFNDHGQIGFNSITELTFSASGGGPYEYLSTTPTTGQITYTVNKAATVVRLDSATGTIIQSGHTINLSNTGDNSHTLYAHPLDDYSDKTASVSFKFNKFKYWAFVDSQDDLTDSDVKEKNIKGTIVNGYPTSRIDFTIGSNESKYIYLLIKKKTSGSFTFKIGQNTTPGQNAGGMTQIGNDINDIYDNSIYYQLWRSTTVKTGNCNIIIS